MNAQTKDKRWKITVTFFFQKKIHMHIIIGGRIKMAKN